MKKILKHLKNFLPSLIIIEDSNISYLAIKCGNGFFAKTRKCMNRHLKLRVKSQIERIMAKVFLASINVIDANFKSHYDCGSRRMITYIISNNKSIKKIIILHTINFVLKIISTLKAIICNRTGKYRMMKASLILTHMTQMIRKFEHGLFVFHIVTMCLGKVCIVRWHINQLWVRDGKNIQIKGIEIIFIQTNLNDMFQ